MKRSAMSLVLGVLSRCISQALRVCFTCFLPSLSAYMSLCIHVCPRFLSLFLHPRIESLLSEVLLQHCMAKKGWENRSTLGFHFSLTYSPSKMPWEILYKNLNLRISILWPSFHYWLPSLTCLQCVDSLY